jgi:predicted Zn-dependent protease
MRGVCQRRLSDRLVRSPFLRLLHFEAWFRVAFAGFCLLLLFLALFLPKIWVVSPRGFTPAIIASGLDLAQAWSLQRNALKAMSAGKFDEANFAWLLAFANNRGDAKIVRGALRCLGQSPEKTEYSSLVWLQSHWLLKLAGTNVADLELVATVFEKYGYHDPLAALLEIAQDRLSARLEASYLKALFNTGRIQAFGNRWSKFSDRLPKDDDLFLYHAAYLAGWSSSRTHSEGLRRLEAACQEPSQRALAARLLLLVEAQQRDADRFGQTLHRLEQSGTATLPDHIAYWRVLDRTGRKSEAIELAQNHPASPASPMEALSLAKLYVELTFRDRALQLFRKFALAFGDAPSFWIVYAHELLEARQWEEAHRVALQMRAREQVRDHLAAFSFYVEGRAESALHRPWSAANAFKKITEWEFHPPGLGLTVSFNLLQLGQAEIARDVLLQLESEFKADAQYWLLLFRAADELKQVELMLTAAERAFHLRPADPVALSYYVAALLITRQRPEEAVRFTFQLFVQSPRSTLAAVNHGAALLLNERPQEAEALLKNIRTNRFTRAQSSLYHFDLFELYFRLHRYDQAWIMHDRIEPEHLYPSQLGWLKQALLQMPPKPQDG